MRYLKKILKMVLEQLLKIVKSLVRYLKKILKTVLEQLLKIVKSLVESLVKSQSLIKEKLRINKIDRSIMGYLLFSLIAFDFFFLIRDITWFILSIFSLLVFILLASGRKRKLKFYIIMINIAKYILILSAILFIVGIINWLDFELIKTNINVYIQIFLIILVLYILSWVVIQTSEMVRSILLECEIAYFTKTKIFGVYFISLIIINLDTYVIDACSSIINTIVNIVINILAFVILGCCFISIFIFMLKYHFLQHKKIKLKMNCINLSNEDIKKRKVYLLSNLLSKQNDDYQIFNFDFENLFPDASTNHTIYITNKYYSLHTFRFKKDDKNKKKTENKEIIEDLKDIYLSIGKFRTNEQLSIHYSYIQDKKQYNMKCDLFLEIKCFESNVYISQYQFRNFRRVKRSFEFGVNSILNPFTNTCSCYAVKDYHLEYHALNSIKHFSQDGEELVIENFDDAQYDTRKWLLHDGKFGSGKTTMDLYFAMQHGYQPVIVSPWEDNYDKDILQLIYLKISENFRGDFFDDLSAIFQTKAFIFWPIAAAAIIVFCDNDIIKGVFDIVYYRILDTFFSSFSIALQFIPLGLHEIRDIFFIFISIIIAYKGLSGFILFKKDSTRDYQDFFITRIKSMYEYNQNILLIIEDIDRLNPDVYNNVFRILSLLNKEFYEKEIIGLISLDRRIIENKTRKNLFDCESKEERSFKDFENKIIYKEIAKNYDYQASMDAYINEGIQFLYQYYDDLGMEELENEAKRKSSDNFRDVRKNMSDIISKYSKGKNNKEKNEV